MRSDFVFDLLATLIGWFICLFCLSVISLTCIGRQVFRYRDDVAVISAFIGLGFGAAIMRFTLPPLFRLFTVGIT